MNEEFVRKLHDQMLNKVWEWAGKFRKTDKNIGVDKHRIGIDLRQLLDDTQYWTANKTYPDDEIATRFHHRLVQVHCFPNGNGRHSRLITDALLTDVLDKEPFTWGNGDLTAEGNVRNIYISALRSADGHNYKPLKRFVRS